jgi:hypothetical protein
MSITTDADVLPESTCWDLLRSTEIGRLAVSSGGEPDIFPVNFTVDHGTLVFRSAAGSKLLAIRATAAVAFEADGYDPATRQAWSVVLHGRAEEIRAAEDLVHTAELPLSPWHGSAKSIFVRVVPDRITGRRFVVVDDGPWQTVLSGKRPASPE